MTHKPTEAVSDERLDQMIAEATAYRDQYNPETFSWGRANDRLLVVTELRTLRSASGVNVGAVKALEWKSKNPIRDNGDIRAHSAVGMYEIGKVAGRIMVMLRCVRRGDADDIDIGSFDTFDAAKAAAQADFNARIMSCLTPSPAREITEAQVFAAMAKADDLGLCLDSDDARSLLTAAMEAGKP